MTERSVRWRRIEEKLISNINSHPQFNPLNYYSRTSALLSLAMDFHAPEFDSRNYFLWNEMYFPGDKRNENSHTIVYS